MNHPARSSAAIASILLLALTGGCQPRDSKDDKGATTADGARIIDPETAAKPEMKGLDPAAPLSRTDMGNGLVIEELKMGAGEIVWPTSRARLSIRGWSVATGQLFWDSTAQPKEVALGPAPRGGREVMKGLREGVPGMRVGGKRRLTIPADKAFGFKEAKNDKGEVVVPQGTPIVLEVEALEVLAPASAPAPSASAPADPATPAPAPNK